MALIQCSECGKQVSERAAACPHCGAPLAAATAPSPPQPSPVHRATRRKTSPLAWVALAVLVVVGLGYFLVPVFSKQRLPPLPVEVKYRQALLGPGLVLNVKNTSSRNLTIVATLRNPTLETQRDYRLQVAPHSESEVGHAEGWVLASGDQLVLSNAEYRSWEGSIP